MSHTTEDTEPARTIVAATESPVWMEQLRREEHRLLERQLTVSPLLVEVAATGSQDRRGADGSVNHPLPAERLSAVIRDPLRRMQGSANLLLRRLERDAEILDSGEPSRDPMSHYARTMLRGVEEIETILRDLDAFSTRPRLELESLSLTPLVYEAIHLASRGLPEEHLSRLGFTVDLAEKNTWIRGDRFQLRRLFVALIQNAIEALEEGGRIRIRGRWEENHYFHVTVEDDGPGIEPRMRSKIFEPFVRGKPGTKGLGLPLARAISRAHGGDIELLPTGTGTCFLVKLPRETGEGVHR